MYLIQNMKERKTKQNESNRNLFSVDKGMCTWIIQGQFKVFSLYKIVKYIKDSCPL